MEEIIIHVTDREGVTHDIDIPLDIDLNLMEVCKAFELPVEGTCGGMALCASCHMYIESDHELDEPSEDEEIMLDQVLFVEENSRLGCQIKVTEAINGLRVRLAEQGLD
jgi:2Fe-2S ferredoxin